MIFCSLIPIFSDIYLNRLRVQGGRKLLTSLVLSIEWSSTRILVKSVCFWVVLASSMWFCVILGSTRWFGWFHKALFTNSSHMYRYLCPILEPSVAARAQRFDQPYSIVRLSLCLPPAGCLLRCSRVVMETDRVVLPGAALMDVVPSLPPFASPHWSSLKV